MKTRNEIHHQEGQRLLRGLRWHIPSSGSHQSGA
jgi:hypothetical protein